MIDEKRLKILTEGAKYDVSCSSSGSRRKNENGGIGNAAFSGICHSFTSDGRCISLLKILMTNDCVFDCKYCPNRRGADVERAVLSPEEICELTINFYKRNYIEGLFLSSAVYKNPDYTMELLIRTMKLLREKYAFNGYVHLKGIPKASPLLTDLAASLADRMSYNLELPGEESLKRLAPQKTKLSLLKPMAQIAERKKEFSSAKKSALIGGGTLLGNGAMFGSGAPLERGVRSAVFSASNGRGDSFGAANMKKRYLPAGQTTQMIVGASEEKDGHILRLSNALYRKFSMKRVYFSAYLPVVNDPLLPQNGEKLLREHRLYQADWLMRFYGFDAEEIASENENLPVEYDPKCAWAIRHAEYFPVEINKAPLEQLLRVPGIGVRSANKIIAARRYASLRYDDLKRMRVVLKRARHFITCGGKFYGEENEERVKALLSAAESADGARQLSLFSDETLLRALPKTTIKNALTGGASENAPIVFDGVRMDVKADEIHAKIELSTPEIKRAVLTGEL